MSSTKIAIASLLHGGDARPSVPTLAADPLTPQFVIAVIGHRHLREDDLEDVRDRVRQFFASIRSMLADSEIIVMTGMAAGGDLMVAETALALGIRVEAVLPMPLRHFVLDFDARNRSLLERLLANPNLSYVELEPPEIVVSVEHPAWRDAAYRNLTDVLIRKGNLMLALWDGKVAHRPGGTADTVLRYLRVRTDENHHARHVEFAPGDPSANTDAPFLYWIPIAPSGTAGFLMQTEPCSLTGLGDTIQSCGAEPPAAVRSRLEDLNQYNKDFRRIASEVSDANSLANGIPADLTVADANRLRRIDAEYVKADALALYYQKRSDGLFGLFGAFAFMIGSLYLIYDKLGENLVFLEAYLSVLAISLVLYRTLYSKIWFVKHLRYRALAETMRVNFYLCLAGVGQRVDSAEILALSGIARFEGFGWIGYMLRNVESVQVRAAQAPDVRCSDYVREAWVENQCRYFKRKVRQLELKSRRVALGQSVTLAITILVLLARMLFASSMKDVYVMANVPLKNVLMLGVGVAALFLGAWKLHQSKMATRELIWQYKNQLTHFSQSSSELQRTAMPARRIEVLVELARRSVMECYIWTIHRYHREHAPPAGG